jgi:hypothetical protein
MSASLPTQQGSLSDYEQTVRAHAAYFAQLAETAAAELLGAGRPDNGIAQRRALQLCELELANLYELLDTAARRRNEHWLLAAAQGLSHYFVVSGAYTQLQETTQRLVLPAAATQSARLSCWTTSGLVQTGRALGLPLDFGALSADLERLLPELEGTPELVQAHWQISRCLSALGEHPAAQQQLETALRCARELGNQRLEALTLLNLVGSTLRASRAAAAEDLGKVTQLAEKYLAGAIVNLQQVGNHHGLRLAYEIKAGLALESGELQTARELLLAAAQFWAFRGPYLKGLEADAHGQVAMLLGEWEAARVSYLQALHHFAAAGAPHYVATAAVMLSLALLRQGHWSLGVPVFLQRDRVKREAYGFGPAEQEIIAQGQEWLAAAVAAGQCTPEQLEGYRATGAALTLPRLGEFILSGVAQLDSAAPHQAVTA